MSPSGRSFGAFYNGPGTTFTVIPDPGAREFIVHGCQILTRHAFSRRLRRTFCGMMVKGRGLAERSILSQL